MTPSRTQVPGHERGMEGWISCTVGTRVNFTTIHSDFQNPYPCISKWKKEVCGPCSGSNYHDRKDTQIYIIRID